MRSLFIVVMAVVLLAMLMAGIQRYLPPGYQPFTPLSVNDPPTWITRLKMRALSHNTAACLSILADARKAGLIAFTPGASTHGACPLVSPVRVHGFGPVALSSSFLASCPLALSSVRFVAQAAAPLAKTELGSPLVRIDHLGSYDCRNIYHRPTGGLSEHASAEALDVASFHLADGRSIGIAQQWRRDNPEGRYLHTLFGRSCDYFGNALGPDYNAAHAGHFHFGMREYGLCR